MGTRGLEVVRFHRRYYIQYHQLDAYFEGLGAKIVADIPADSEEFRKWLASMREEYATIERSLEKHVYEIQDTHEPDYAKFEHFEALPSELPRLDDLDAEYIYIINLDDEVLTMNYSIHWALGNIPRENDLWRRAIVNSIYRGKPTISLALCAETHMASPALEFPEPHPGINYDFHVVEPRRNVREGRKAFLTLALAYTFLEYKNEIVRFGREWDPDAFPFRELAFALVSIASGQASFHSFPAQRCDPRKCGMWRCNSNHLPKSAGWLDKEWAGDRAPLLEFGSPSHRPGDPPGVSPNKKIYWLEGILVSLVLVVDGQAISNAVDWAIEQGHTSFQAVVMSLFDVAFAEVYYKDGEPFVELSDVMYLSPLRVEYCLSTHPRERPEFKPGMQHKRQRGELVMQSNCTGTTGRLETQFPGLAALVNFFEVAGNRRVACTSTGALPEELYDLILDFVDYDTWKTCLTVSSTLRSCCLRKYRLDDRSRIVSGPFVRLQKHRKEPLLSFDFENLQTGKILPMIHVPHCTSTEEYNWMPVIGSNRKALVSDTTIQFRPAADVPVEVDYHEKFS